MAEKKNTTMCLTFLSPRRQDQNPSYFLFLSFDVFYMP